MNKSAYDFDQEIARACARLRELAKGNIAPSARAYNAQRGDCRTPDYFNQHGYSYSALVERAGLIVRRPGNAQAQPPREVKVTPPILERVRDLLRQLAGANGRMPRQTDYNAVRSPDMPSSNTLHAHGYAWDRLAEECGLKPPTRCGVAVDGVPPEVEAEIVAALQRGDHLPTWKIAWPLFSEKTPPRQPPPEEPTPQRGGNHRPPPAYAIPGTPAPTSGHPASDDARAAMLRKVAARLRQMAAPHESAGVIVAPTSEEYDRRRGADMPSSATLRAAYRIQWRDLCAAAGLRIRRGNGIAPDLTGLDAAPAIPDVRIVMDDAPGSALTGNISSEKPPPAVPPARSLAEIEADPRLPRPQRDPLTGQLIPPRDAAGHAIWRVRVYGADERTCAMCGETFTPRIVRNSHGAPMQIGYCERCGVEDRDGAGAPVAAPNVRTLAYLQDGEAEIVAMAPA